MSESKLYPRIKNCLSKGFNIVKIIGNICAFVLLCLLCVLLGWGIIYRTISYDGMFIDIGKGNDVSRWIMYPIDGTFLTIMGILLVKTAPRLLKPWKLGWHILYWLLPFVMLYLMVKTTYLSVSLTSMIFG